MGSKNKRGKIMKTKRIKLFSLIIAAFILVGASIGLILSNMNKVVYATEVIVGEWTQKDGAFVGDTLIVPQSVKLQVDENTQIDAESGLVYFPDGNARSLEPKLLDQAGKYVLEYQAKYNGKTVKGEYSFVVKESNYFVSNTTLSSAKFTKKENLKYAEFLEKGSNLQDGIEVVLGKGDYFRFNKPINLYDVAGSDGIVNVSRAFPVMDKSLISGDAFGDRLGSYFTIKLIDCYDEDNFIEFYYWSNQWNPVKDTQVGAGTGEQNFSSIALDKSGSASATVTIGKDLYIPKYSGRYLEGKPGLIGKWAYTNTKSLYSNNWNMFSYNVNTHEIYFHSAQGNQLITDVDHPDIYPTNAFKGFTTGEVFVQYSFENSWTSEPMELYINSILGLTGEQIQQEGVSDNLIPDVEIDIEYTDQVNKSINVLYNQEYTLPTANVYDVNGKNEYKLAVYYDYYTDNPKSVYVEDGKFTPNKKGVTYTAVYLATDGFGNTNVDENGKCLDVVNMIPISGKAFNYEEVKVKGFDGATLNYLPKINVLGANKEADIKVIVIEPNGNELDVTNSCDGEKYSFNADYVGEYTVQYTFTDNVYEEVFEYKVGCSDKGNVIFLDKIALPSVFIKDAVYDLDTYYAYVATSNGLKKNAAKLLVSVDGGEFAEITNQRKFKVEGNSTLQFKAEYNGKQTGVQTSKITDVNYSENSEVNDGLKIYQNYFVGFDSTSSNESYVEYKFNGNNGVNLQFATPVVFNTFRLNFEVPEEYAKKVSSINVILKEISGQDKGYVISYSQGTTASTVYYTVKSLDGSTTYKATSVTGTIAGSHTLTISNSTLTSGEGIVVLLDKVSSRNIEFSINAYDVSSAFALRISNVCGTAFNELVYEKNSQLVYERPVGSPKVGEKYTLPTFNVSSVFYPVSLANLTYSFVDESNNPLVDVNGKKVENISGDSDAITIIPIEPKIYYLKFNYAGMRVTDPSSYMLVIIDTEAPVVTFNDGSTDKTVVDVKVGKAHAIKEFKVADNVTAAEGLLVKVMIMDDSSAIVGWNVKENFTFNKAGSYKVVVFAQDENGNTSRTYYRVSVTD